MNKEEIGKIDQMCHPRGLAIFGGVSRQGAFANTILLSHLIYGFKGKIYPISRQGEEVAGLRIYRKLSDVDGPVDMACVAVPFNAVPGVLRECLDFGVAGVTIQASGFAETGQKEGIELQKEIERFAELGLMIVGPNCFGIHCPESRLTFLPGPDFPKEPGNIGMVFQSGGLVTDLIHEAAGTGVRFSKAFSFGNGSGLDAIKLIEYLADDSETEIITAYLEGVDDGRRFLETIKTVSAKKPVLVWKGGLTPPGSRATISHTGSMGGEAHIWNCALHQANVLPIQGFDNIMDTLVALSFLKCENNRIGVIGGGGAIGVYAADLAFQLGLEVPRLSDETQKILKKIFPQPGAGMNNPIDMARPSLPVDLVKALVKEVMIREPIDTMVVNTIINALEVGPRIFNQHFGASPPAGQQYLDELLVSLNELKQETGKDIVLVLENRAHWVEDIGAETLLRRAREKFQKTGIPVFANSSRALTGLKNALTARRLTAVASN
jgi:acyl-CoA synthetase (NDP forming)